MARHRKLRGRKLKKQRRIIIASVIGLTLLLSTGYAAFSTNISLSAKGNIKEKKKTAAEQLTQSVEEVSSTVDGLYKDTAEDPVDGKYRYIYKGADPDNYFTFNNEEAGWRIVSIESDGTIKLIHMGNLGNQAWDAASTRSSGTDTYCSYAQYGCNAWAKTSSLASTNSTLSSGLASGTFHQYGTNGGTNGTDYSGTVTVDASLNTYLNEDYYVNTLKSNTNIEKHDFYVSTPGNSSDTEDIKTDVEQEKLYTWNGYVGLITATDYMRASTSSSCTTLNAAYNSPYPCKDNNYLYTSGFSWWTISPYVHSYCGTVWFVYSDGRLSNDGAGGTNTVRPTLFLKKDINLKGEGTSEKPYYIDES